MSDMVLHSSGGLRNWFARATGSHHLARAKTHVVEAGHTVRAMGEGGIVGGILGAADASLTDGLDQKIPGTQTRVPVDGALGALAGIAAIGLANEGVGGDLRNAAGACSAVWGYRKMRAWTASKGGLSKIAGEAGGFGAEGPEDPIVACAKDL